MKENPNVVTGWRVRDGISVYLGSNRTWVTDLNQAQIFTPSELDTELAWAKSPQTELEIVDPYPMVVTEHGAGGRRVRETIRAVGPTVRPDLHRETSFKLSLSKEGT